jgi:ATP-dependent helicase/nuclease subunit A
MKLTPAQKRAIAARGNVLVVAGAGTGKTSTLVARCLDCLTQKSPPVSLDEILMVTFTDAAASEMRQRIRETFLSELSGGGANPWLAEQLALFDAAHIGTLHQFCFQIIRQHFYQLAIDPQVSVMAEEEAWLLAHEVLEKLFESAYSGAARNALAIQQLVQSQGGGEDEVIRELVLRIHKYTQTLPDPASWFDRRLQSLRQEEPLEWEGWLRQAVIDWRGEFLSRSAPYAAENFLAGRCHAILLRLSPELSNADFSEACSEVEAAIKEIPRGQKGESDRLLGEFLEAAEFLGSLTAPNASGNALRADWGWIREDMITLLSLARDFGKEFSRSKRELGLVDFNDLEQHSLELLWDREKEEPTAIAREWRQKLQFVFVDEYQDINAAQDKIVQALSREGKQANRFLVGDMKQSIYRFRLADPRIFQKYLRDWSKGGNQIIALVENFRSRPGILSFVNSLFETLMIPQIGGITYDEKTRLVSGSPEGLDSPSETNTRAVEFHLRLKSPAKNDSDDDEGDGSLLELLESEKEARMIGLRLLALKKERFMVRDRESGIPRSVEWRDIAVLLRAPASKAEAFAKEFARLEIPMVVARTRFYESSEILDLLNLLRLLDNPLQDLPLIAVLRSPMAGFTLNELAAVRLAEKGRFWNALIRWPELNAPPGGLEFAAIIPLRAKVALFLERYARWRREVRQVALTRCLEAVVAETDYEAWLLIQPRGEQRLANVRRFLTLAGQFDQFQRQGLFRFLRFVEAQQKAETEPEVANVADQDAVRLMSIHQSKGLEFPVVVAGDLGKKFNTRDLRSKLVLDEEYGLCPQIMPPRSGGHYPSLPLWLARKRQHHETLGEELRLLYVATTRARDLLILSGSLTRKTCETSWLSPAKKVDLQTLASATSFSDWLGVWFAGQGGAAILDEVWEPNHGENDFARWVLHSDVELLSGAGGAERDEIAPIELSAADAEALAARFAWHYPHANATRQAAKTSVSTLRRQAQDLENPSFPMEVTSSRARPVLQNCGPRPVTSSLDRGVAHHKFLELFSLQSDFSERGLRKEAMRMAAGGFISNDEVALLDFKSLSSFWTSELGKAIAARPELARRELPFTARFSPRELADLQVGPSDPTLSGEFVIVQGVADLVVVEATQIWLVDFKTDAAAAEEVEEKAATYRPQLLLYARALTKIYRRPVTRCALYFLAATCAVEIEIPQLREA